VSSSNRTRNKPVERVMMAPECHLLARWIFAFLATPRGHSATSNATRLVRWIVTLAAMAERILSEEREPPPGEPVASRWR